jgi:hypothetical protein
MATGTTKDLDDLFQLPLGEFTAARNALARRATNGDEIRSLSKPPLAAWAINQLYWQQRDTYDDLVRAATDMRKVHKAVIEGKRGDLRSAGREHELALETAVKATLAILEASGSAVTEATRQSVINTLRALPATEPPGRLTQTLSPGGFEMLAGIVAAPQEKAGSAKPAGAPGRSTGGTSKRESGRDLTAERQREARAAAERAVRDADRTARHAEFEAARARRNTAKAGERLDEARQAFEEARVELETAEAEAARASEAARQADKRSADAGKALAAAKAHRTSMSG